MAMGNYELAITEARPDPLVETVALLEEFCRQDGDCDLTALVGDGRLAGTH